VAKFSHGASDDLLSAFGPAVGSHRTVQEYVEALEACFAVRTLCRYNPAKDRGFLCKNRKIYFTDPFLYHALNEWIRGTVDIHATACAELTDPGLAERLIEAMVIEHAARLFNERVYYWQNRVEVDLAVKAPLGLVPIEVKFQDQIGRYDAKPLKQMGGGILVSRDAFLLLDGIPVLPAALFLAPLSR